MNYSFIMLHTPNLYALILLLGRTNVMAVLPMQGATGYILSPNFCGKPFSSWAKSKFCVADRSSLAHGARTAWHIINR